MKITTYLLVAVRGERVDIVSFPTEKEAKDEFRRLYKEACEYYGPKGGFTVDWKDTRVCQYYTLFNGQQIENVFVKPLDIA